MTYLRLPKNIKVCPECGTNLIITARHCAVCGYQYTDDELQPVKEAGLLRSRRRFSALLVNMAILFGLVILLVGMAVLLNFGLQKRKETKALLDSEHATATYVATTYVSPTPTITMTLTPPPPTETPVPKIEYTVVSGDSCLSIATRFNIDLGSLLQKNNDVDCALLNVGTVLEIPQPTPTPEPSLTPTP